MPGARCTRSLACKIKQAYEHSHHGHTGNHPAFPAQWFYGLLRALPGDQACLTPSPALLIADLTPALGRQNDTTWPYASALLVKHTARVHRIPPHVRNVRTPLGHIRTAPAVLKNFAGSQGRLFQHSICQQRKSLSTFPDHALAVKLQAVDDLVDHLALGAHGEADQIEIGAGHRPHRL